VHIVPPHGVVFEIRVADGYGARWNEDGSKVCGYPLSSGIYLLPYWLMHDIPSYLVS